MTTALEKQPQELETTKSRFFYIDSLALSIVPQLLQIRERSWEARCKLYQLGEEALGRFDEVLEIYSRDHDSLSATDRIYYWMVERLIETAHSYDDARATIQRAGEDIANQLTNGDNEYYLFNGYTYNLHWDNKCNKYWLCGINEQNQQIYFNCWEDTDGRGVAASIDDYISLISNLNVCGLLTTERSIPESVTASSRSWC